MTTWNSDELDQTLQNTALDSGLFGQHELNSIREFRCHANCERDINILIQLTYHTCFFIMENDLPTLVAKYQRHAALLPDLSVYSHHQAHLLTPASA
jgi:hypothetical protein